jgi:POT family proton-dependent oligopeptide transporter
MPAPQARHAIPPGAGALFFIQIFATLGFAVLYSTLVLYATKRLGFNESSANAMMGVFGAFNYGLHMFGGYLGGRFLSNRNLFVLGMVLQVIGCALIAVAGVWGLYWGLAMFLTGSGLNVTCINMMLTQRFKPDDDRRESAFLWNYAGMNLGFFVGFTVAGYFQLTENYRALFLFATLGNAAAIIVAVCRWRILADLNTPLHDASRSQYRWRMLVGLAVLVALVPIIRVMLTHAEFSGHFVIVLGALIFLMLCVVTLRHHPRDERRRMAAYLILALGSLVFWALYQLAPMGLMLFSEHNINLNVDPEHQHAGDRGGRPAAGLVVQSPARSRLQHRHSAAVLRIAVLYRARHAGAAAGHQHGGRRRAGGV